MAEVAETTEPKGASLEDAAQGISSLLFGKPETKEKAETKPEQSKADTAQPETEQAAPEPEEKSEEIEAAKSEAEEETEGEPEKPDTVPRYKAKVDGEDVEVTLEEALKGYSRTQDYTRKTQALANERKEFLEKEVASVRAQRQQYEEYLGKLEDVLNPKEPDWTTLKQTLDPSQFAAKWTEWDQTQRQLKSVREERARVQAEQKREAEDGFQKMMQEEQNQLFAKLPALKDPDKAAALRKELSEAALQYGFSEEDLASVTNHRVLLILHDAAQFRKSQVNKPKVENKINKVLETQAPGTTTKPTKKNELQLAIERTKKSGKVEDAARGIAHLLG